MTRNPPTKKPHSNHDVIVKLNHTGEVLAARWTGRKWKLTRDIYLADRSIECWWPIPTETQLDNLHDYAVVGHKGEIHGSMGPFLCGIDLSEEEED